MFVDGCWISTLDAMIFMKTTALKLLGIACAHAIFSNIIIVEHLMFTKLCLRD